MSRVILVGHCGVDAPRLEAEISKCLQSADITTVNSEDDLEQALEQGADLLLFNRELPFGFEVDEGVELMNEVHQRHPNLKMMLISDYDEAQAEARQVGAIPGFGKADLGSDKVGQCLRNAMAN